MNSSEQIVRGHAARTDSDTVCRERQELLYRLNEAFAGFSDAVRESRERGLTLDGDHTEAAGARCAKAWTELQSHQEKHGCWRQRE